jgi:hypothetical protein
VLPCQALSQKGLGVSAKACLPASHLLVTAGVMEKRFGMNVVGKPQGFSPIGIIGKNQKNYNGHFLKNKMLVPLSISFF